MHTLQDYTVVCSAQFCVLHMAILCEGRIAASLEMIYFIEAVWKVKLIRPREGPKFFLGRLINARKMFLYIPWIQRGIQGRVRVGCADSKYERSY